MANERTSDAGMGDHQRRRSVIGCGTGSDVVQRVRRSCHDSRIRLEGDRAVVGLEPAGPAQLDLLRGQAFPLAGVRLLQPGVDDRFAEAERTGDDRRRLRGPAQVARPDRREIEAEGDEQASGRGRLLTAQFGERRVGRALPAPHSVPFALSVAQHQDRDAASGHPDGG